MIPEVRICARDGQAAVICRSPFATLQSGLALAAKPSRLRAHMARKNSAPGPAASFCFLEEAGIVRFTVMFLRLKPARRKILLLPLIAATYFMVSGGPYGIEDILGGAGYGWAILILVLLPVVWSMPTALMVGELASAIPADGGFYVWVRRAMGPFWGYQESWLSLSASIFDMALYPSIFVLYLGKFSPALTAGWRGYFWSLAVVVLCCAWNLRGASEVGDGAVGLFVLLLVPFTVFVVLGLWRGLNLHPAVQWGRPAGAGTEAGLSTAILVALWNYMGWDNASTVAQEVENPQRNHPRAMAGAAILTAFTYILPLATMALGDFRPRVSLPAHGQ